MNNYTGKARNALARTLSPPASTVRVQPLGRIAWVLVALAAVLALLTRCAEVPYPVTQGNWAEHLPSARQLPDGGVP